MFMLMTGMTKSIWINTLLALISMCLIYWAKTKRDPYPKHPNGLLRLQGFRLRLLKSWPSYLLLIVPSLRGFGPCSEHIMEMSHWAMITFAAMLGKVGKKGEGVGFSWHYGGGGMPPSGKSGPVGLAQGRNPVTTRCPASRSSEMLLNPGK